MSRPSQLFCFLAAASMCALARPTQAEVRLASLESSTLDAKLAGRVWLEELNCAACHATAAADLAASSRNSPRLAEVRGRVQPDFLRAFIANPSAVKPGTLMPEVLGDLTGAERENAASAITHFLVSLGTKEAAISLQAPDAVAAERGEKLFHSVGCVACHSPRDAGGQEIMVKRSVPLGALEGKYSIRSLVQFLKHPQDARPSGRMPEMGLADAEVERIAHYLLRKTQVPGHLAYTMWRGQVYEGLDGAVEKERAGLVDDFSLERFGSEGVVRQTAIRYEGFLKLDRAGEFTFYLEMNGGSLRLNDTKVGAEAPSNRRGVKLLSGKATLKEGWNKIELTYFHTGQQPRLRFEMEGAGLPRGPIPAERLSVSDTPLPLFKPLTPDAALVARGKALVERFNCARCHEDLREVAPPARVSFPQLAEVDPAKGCLAETPTRNAPHFDLGADQKALLRAALPTVENEKLSDAQVIDKTLVALNCIACHERKGLGGIDPARDVYFTGTREALGNQGHVPPPLTEIGAKLTPEWMTGVLLRGGQQRPYLKTRMPQFGEGNVGHLIKLFEKVDALEETAMPKVANIQESKQAGYGMIGTDGFSCIACHDFNGQQSAGAGALDLVGVTKRLKKNWFHLYLREPYRFHPTGIMPTYWPGGQALRKEVLGGDTAQQIEALWNYLADGERAKLPKGLSRQSQVLRVADEAVICRGRGTVAGFRGFGVGYPERISLAFDSEQMSLRLLWRGEFADVDNGTFHARSREPIQFAPGIPFHPLASLDAEWPYKGKTDFTFPQDQGYQFLGYRLDKVKRPTLQYRYREVTVEDFFEDRLDEAGRAFFRRTLTLSSPAAQTPFYFRAATGKKITVNSPDTISVDALQLRITSGQQVQTRDGDPAEVLVPLTLEKGITTVVLEYRW